KNAPQKCVLPALKVDDPLMMSYVKKPSPLSCSFPTVEWVYVQNGTLVYSQEAIAKVGKFSCDVSPLVRVPKNDNSVKWGTTIRNVSSGAALPADFFKVECRRLAANSPRAPSPQSYDYTDILMGVAPNNRAVWAKVRGVKPPANGLGGLSVLMLGFDSMSRMSWMRRMKSSRDYLVNGLGAIELEGYNIMGDGTPAALFPILTGDLSHLILSYLILFCLILSYLVLSYLILSCLILSYLILSYLILSYLILSYLILSYLILSYLTLSYLILSCLILSMKFKRGCRANTPRHRDWLNWVKDIYHMYPSQPKFMMHFYALLSHDDNNPISLADDDLKAFLEEMESRGYLNSTILVVFGDHGARYDFLRATWAGRLEERLPYMSFRFPPWFGQKYPHLLRNFRTNAHRLSTPMDLHETLHDVIRFDGMGVGDITKRGISLFKEIPAERECKHADVGNHWCACLDWKQVQNPESDAGTVRALQTALEFINNQTESQRHLCASLEIEKVTSAQTLRANEDFLMFSKSLKDGRLPLLSAKSKSTIKEPVELYQLMFMTKPGKGLFEVTVTNKGHVWSTSEKDISRINKYGDAPFCVLSINRQLRQYCYCNSLVGKS
ncbi:hypothetical protein EGW08_009019, partial [Elysia chlorotica]